MGHERVQRRLAAILAADVVGYSRLIEADEEGTRARLRNLFAEVVDPRVAADGGRIVNTAGDGVLVEYPSAVDAVRSALAIQQGVRRRNADIPEERQIELRIGLNVGDVIVEDDDIHGEGVNVAARLEGLCEPGAVYVSGSVYDQVAGRLMARFEDLGQRTLKNMARPVQVYRLASDDAEAGLPDATAAILRRPAVAVLPFVNMSGDPEQEYFADGLTEDLITALSQWRTFPVIARNSTFAFKGKAAKIQQVAQELGARYVIEGSVRKGADRIRVTIQLIDAETGHHMWAERYDRELSDIFALQDDITVRVAGSVAPALERWEIRKSSQRQPQNLDAWGCVHRGMAFVYEVTPQGLQEARRWFERAISLDPSYSRAFAGLAYTHVREVYFGLAASRNSAIDSAMELGHKALTLDEFDSLALNVVGIAMTLSNHADMRRPFERAAAINPSDSIAHAGLGMTLITGGEPDLGITHLEWALQLSPREPRNAIFLGFLAHGHLTARRYEVAAEKARQASTLRPGSPEPHLLLAAALGHLGQRAEAAAALAACERIQPGYTRPSGWTHHYRRQEDEEHFLDGLRKAGLRE